MPITVGRVVFMGVQFLWISCNLVHLWSQNVCILYRIWFASRLSSWNLIYEIWDRSLQKKLPYGNVHSSFQPCNICWKLQLLLLLLWKVVSFTIIIGAENVLVHQILPCQNVHTCVCNVRCQSIYLFTKTFSLQVFLLYSTVGWLFSNFAYFRCIREILCLVQFDLAVSSVYEI